MKNDTDIQEKKPTPNYFWSMLTMRCPRCRRGRMFRNASAYKKITLKYIFEMPERCEVCSQKYDLEPGFWYGTAYVSYALTVAISASTFVAWIVLIGISAHDRRVFYWLIANAIILVLLQPWLMRLSRVIYMRFFIRYDPNYEKSAPTVFN